MWIFSIAQEAAYVNNGQCQPHSGEPYVAPIVLDSKNGGGKCSTLVMQNPEDL